MKVTAEQCVMALKRRNLNSTAKELADYLGTDSRAVATAMRKPVRDGRVTIRYTRGLGFGASYRFVRLKAVAA